MKKNKPNNSSHNVLIAIIILVITAVIGIGVWQSIDKNEDLNNKTISSSDQTTQVTSKPTNASTTESTTQLKLGTINNVGTNIYSVSDNENGGFMGVTISFNSVENATGYRIKYIFDYGDYEEYYQNIGASDTNIYFGTQEGPTQIEICAFNTNDNGTIYGEWINVYDIKKNDYTNMKEIQFNEWQNIIKGYIEIDPYFYLEK